MSKTTEIQIEKSRNLIEGLRRHVREMGERGVSNNEINEMEKTVAMLSEANAEVDRLREELTPKVKKMNDLMVLVKASYAESKKTLKTIHRNAGQTTAFPTNDKSVIRTICTLQRRHR